MSAHGRGLTDIVVGPVHAGIIEPGRFTIGSGGETIASFDMQLGFSGRGVEAFLIGSSLAQAAARVARICGACSVARSLAFAQAVEDLARAEIDEETQTARLLLAELERIYNHLFDLGAMCAGAGYGYGRTAALGLVERVHRLCAALTGHRFLFDAIVPGGVTQIAPADTGALEWIAGEAERLIEDVQDNDSVRRRFEGTGRLVSHVARELGAVGPVRRACGDTADLRADRPYGAYRRIVPKVPSAAHGDVAARFTVKAGELRESFRLVRRALDDLAGITPPKARLVVAAAGTAGAIVEGPRGAEAVQVTCDKNGIVRDLRVTSASSRNWPLLVHAMEGNIIPDFPLINKSFNLCYACADR